MKVRDQADKFTAQSRDLQRVARRVIEPGPADVLLPVSLPQAAPVRRQGMKTPAEMERP